MTEVQHPILNPSYDDLQRLRIKNITSQLDNQECSANDLRRIMALANLGLDDALECVFPDPDYLYLDPNVPTIDIDTKSAQTFLGLGQEASLRLAALSK